MDFPNNTIDDIQSDNGWDKYWNLAGTGGAFSSKGTEESLFKQQWFQLFEKMLAQTSKVRILDVASGNGLLATLATSYFNKRAISPELYCLDSSSSAISSIRQRLPKIHGTVANANDMPYESNTFDLVVSQFGIEYADKSAITETARVLSSNGEAMFICHFRNGEIFLQCNQQLEIIKCFLESDFLNYCQDAFSKKVGLNQKNTPLSEFKKSDQKLRSAAKKVHQILTKYEQEPASQTLNLILADISVMYKNVNAYRKQDLFVWLQVTINEIEAYRFRMKSMINAALDGSAVGKMVGQMLDLGLEIIQVKPMRFSQEEKNIAWLLHAKTTTTN